ncbi:uncharacterized protein LOC123037217 [Drosophila rhopaloa]|uniref:Uncharacterized protein n=1 Tax=Drosophila rhopaloa TaxID=1041015 RepID=A0ABM5J291_DRORH|nr:uncharacterized protein LOC123037217 [Drosophila rhopaloa]
MALSAKGKPLSLDAAITKRPKITGIQKKRRSNEIEVNKEVEERMEMDHTETPENITDSCETNAQKGINLENGSKNQPKEGDKENGIASNKGKHSMQAVAFTRFTIYGTAK